MCEAMKQPRAAIQTTRFGGPAQGRMDFSEGTTDAEIHGPMKFLVATDSCARCPGTAILTDIQTSLAVADLSSGSLIDHYVRP